MIRLLLNLLWAIVGGGVVIWFEYMLAGLLLCLSVVGIPFGLQCFKIASFGLWPFGRTAMSEQGGSAIGCLLNGVWLIVAGLWICLSHLVLGIGLGLTIIGIPFAWQHFKLAALALAPFGLSIRELD